VFRKLFPHISQRERFALLKFDGTQNLGDEIQSIAAKRFLPRIDAWVDRERLDEFRASKPHKIILNGWFLHRPEHWPPSTSLHPLIISFHLTREIVPGSNISKIAPSDTVLKGNGLEFLKRHEPIGARDLDTLAQLRSAGIDAYFSGCLTLTLRVATPIEKHEIVYAVDVSDGMFAHLSRNYEGRIIRLVHGDSKLKGPARFARASHFLQCYAQAQAVVTTRLHCALPCLALGTPVLLIEEARDHYRFDGLRDLLWHTSEKELLQGNFHYDLRHPPSNKEGWHSLRDALEGKCRAFADNSVRMQSG
jgi:hypothetical protein